MISLHLPGFVNRRPFQNLLTAMVFLGFTSSAYADTQLPTCIDGQTLVYSAGKLVCGSACPALVYFNSGVAFNVPASNRGDAHPPADKPGIHSGAIINGTECTFHLECSAVGWTTITTAADACKTIIQDVP
jgi:hypothetical protein